MAAEGAAITAVVVAEARMVLVAEVALTAAVEDRMEAVPTVTNCSACSPPERRAGFFFADASARSTHNSSAQEVFSKSERGRGFPDWT
jgi:hypothetical protein